MGSLEKRVNVGRANFIRADQRPNLKHVQRGKRVVIYASNGCVIGAMISKEDLLDLEWWEQNAKERR